MNQERRREIGGQGERERLKERERERKEIIFRFRDALQACFLRHTQSVPGDVKQACLSKHTK